MKVDERNRMKDRLSKKLAREFVGNFWKWRGTEFINYAYAGVEGATAWYEFHVGANTIKSVILTEEDYNIPDSVRMFTGDNAVAECVDWTAEKLIELYETVSERTAPYLIAHEAYKRARAGRNG